ncbi:MAG: hypothetical protein SGJ02_10010, partial [bacterium]|nr:hypothetical protein [bacterium]
MSNWIGNSIVEKSIDKLGRYLQSSPGTYFFLFALLIYLFLGTLEADPDLFARIAMGRWLEKFGSFPIKDPFSFTSTKAIWIDHEWLSGVVFYRIVSAFGDVGLFIFKIILSLLTIGILNATVKKSSSRSLSLFLLFIFANELSVVWMSTVRSQIFTYLFIPIFLYLITIHKKFQDKTLLFLSPLIMALWCNLHGGFVVGLGILGAYSFAKIVLRQSGAVPVFFSFVASIFSTLLNPYGFSYWKFMFMALSMPRVTITEWAGASFLDPAHLIFWIFITISIWQLIKNRKSLPLEGSLLLIVCAYGAISHIRFSSVFLMMFIIY